MSIKIKTSLKNIIKRIKILANKKKLLEPAGKAAQAELIKNWNKGIGGDDTPMPRLTDKYKQYKVKHGGKGIRNIKLNNVLRQSFTYKISGDKIVLGFTADQHKKAKGNVKYAPNMMHTSERMASILADTMADVLKGKRK